MTSSDASSDDIVIAVRGVTKAYRIWRDPSARLKFPLLQALGGILPLALQPAFLRRRIATTHETPYYRDFSALKNVNLTIRRGEAVGIVGRNGCGKSTLLQIICGTLTPTEGTATTHGRIAALLELGSGFNPEFTGRENVFLNASILGLTREETVARFDSIADFAEIGDFIDQPVRTYSSGMMVRLAFAVAAHVDPDILIIDEALSVGDARFQLKCARAIDRFIERGVTLLFVSHDASLVKRLCNRAILIQHGQVLCENRPNDIINIYSKLTADGGSVESIASDIAALAERGKLPPETRVSAFTAPELPDPVAATLLADEREHTQISGSEFAYGGERGRILDIELRDSTNQPRLVFNSGEAACVHMIAEARDTITAPIFALTVKNTAGVEIYGTNTLFTNHPAPPLIAGQRIRVSFSFPLNLMTGTYFLSFGFVQFVGEELVVLQRRYDVIKLEVHTKDRSFGIANLHARILCQTLPSP